MSGEKKIHGSVATSGSKSSESIRIYIPKEIVEELKIKVGDEIIFTTDIEDGELIGKFKKVSWKRK